MTRVEKKENEFMIPNNLLKIWAQGAWVFLCVIFMPLLLEAHSEAPAPLTLNSEEKAWLAANPNIRLAGLLGLEPAVIAKPDGSVTGIVPEILDLVSQSIGQTIRLAPLIESGRLIDETIFAGDTYGNAMLVDSLQHRREYLVTEPYMATHLILFANSITFPGIRSPEDLKGKRVVAIRDHETAIRYLKAIGDVDILTVGSMEEQLRMVQYRKADALIGYANYHYQINRLLFSGIQMAFASKQMIGVRFGIKKDYPLLYAILGKAVAALDETQKQAIFNHWIQYKRVGQNGKLSLMLTPQEQRFIREHPVVRVGSKSDRAPYDFVEHGISKGYSNDYIRLLAQKAGFSLDFVQTDRTNMVEKLQKGEIDLLQGVDKAEESGVPMRYSTAYLRQSIVLFCPKHSRYSSVADFAQKRVAVEEGRHIARLIKDRYPGMIVVEKKGTRALFDAVNSGEVDAFVDNLAVGLYLSDKKGYGAVKVCGELALPNLKNKNLYLGVRQDWPLLQSILEKAKQAVSDEEMRRLRVEWFIDLLPYMALPSPGGLELTPREHRYLKEKGTINLCIDPDWMPFEKNEEGRHVGMTADYFKLLEASIGTPIRMVPTRTWMESIAYGKSRKCDIFSLVMPTRERLEYLDFTLPYLSIPLVIVTDIDKPFIADIPSVTGKMIGVIQGYAYTEILKEKYPGMRLVDVTNLKEGLDLVEKGKLYGLVGALATAGYTIQKHYTGQLKIAGKFNETWDLGIGTRNDEPILLDIFNKAIAGITSEQRQEILNRWISVSYERGVNYWLLVRWVSATVLVLGLIIWIVIRANRRLNREVVRRRKIECQLQRYIDLVDENVISLTLDITGKIENVSKALCRISGFPREKLIGKRLRDLRAEDVTEAFYELMMQYLLEHDTWLGEIKNRNAEGKPYWLNTNITVSLNDREQKIGYIAIMQDITNKKILEEISITDSLTGIYNRRYFDALFPRLLNGAKREDAMIAFAMMDIDHFKLYNDTYGHMAGDEVLRRVAKILGGALKRADDYCFRLGGEEFGILIKGVDESKIAALLNEIRESIVQIKIAHAKNDAGHGYVSASFGFSVKKAREVEEYHRLFKEADRALYRAKEGGRNQVCGPIAGMHR